MAQQRKTMKNPGQDKNGERDGTRNDGVKEP